MQVDPVSESMALCVDDEDDEDDDDDGKLRQADTCEHLSVSEQAAGPTLHCRGGHCPDCCTPRRHDDFGRLTRGRKRCKSRSQSQNDSRASLQCRGYVVGTSALNTQPNGLSNQKRHAVDALY
jgi:hypothetical protein